MWDHHASLILDPDTPGFRINAGASALLLVNGEPSLTSRIRNGDILDLGNLRIACWLSPVRQRPLHLREAAVAVLIAAVFAAQFWILYRLP